HNSSSRRRARDEWVGALELGPRPVIAERGHPRRYQRREARIERGAIEVQRLAECTTARIEQDIGTAEQTQQMLARGGLAQVEHDRFLVAVIVPEEQRALETRLVFEERSDPPCRITLGRLDLDDLGAEPCQQQPRIFGALG